jgi:hypothetical protein
MTASFLVPPAKETGRGEDVPKDWFDKLLKELSDKLGGATSFVWAPGHGLWQSGGGTKRDTIAVFEVMADGLLADYWRALRESWSRSSRRMRSSSAASKSSL